MAAQNKLKDDQYRNWVRGALGLAYLQEGLQDFTNTVTKAQQSTILQFVRQKIGNPCAKCVQCSVKDILPAHSVGKRCIQKNKGKCNCRKKTNKTCQICSNIYDEIIQQHRFNDPNWETDASKWCTDHWQIAKCFMTTTSPGSNNSAKETDASGLLSIIINGVFFQNELSCQINPPCDDFSLARIARNEILHNASLQLSDSEVSRYLSSMIHILEDGKTLLNNPVAKGAVEILKLISNDKLVITYEVESKAIATSIKAIEEKTDYALKKIQETRDKIIADVNVESKGGTHKMKEKLKNLIRSHKDHEMRLQAVESKTSDLETRLIILENEVSTLKDLKNTHQKRLEYLNQKQELQKQLVDQYKDYVSTEVSPLIPEGEVDLSKVFVPFKINLHSSSVISNKDSQDNAVRSLCDVIFDEGGERRKNIYVRGSAGVGKTTFCKAILFMWINAQTRSEPALKIVSNDQKLKEKIESDEKRNNDNETIGKFDFLFYISLRHAYQEQFVEQMILNQSLYEDQSDLLYNILRQEPEKCLVLLDGLDEWNLPSSFRGLKGNTVVPLRKSKSKYTIITTTRRWKLDQIRLPSHEIDLEVNLDGIDQKARDTLIKTTVNELNARMKGHKHMYIYKFKEEVAKLQLHDICKTPILLKLLVCLWYDEETLGKSYCSIYSALINTILKHANERYCNDESFQNLKHQLKSSNEKTQLPNFLKEKEFCLELSSLLVSLSKLGYRALFCFDRESALVFKIDDISQVGLSATEIEISKKIGFLSVTEQPGKSAMNRYSCYQFMHKTIQEFFAALYIFELSQGDKSVPEEVKSTWNSPVNVLEGSVVLKFLCGLSPKLGEVFFKYIAHICNNDENLPPYYIGTERTPENVTKAMSVTASIQDMTEVCISECLKNGSSSIKFCIADLKVDINSKIQNYKRNLNVTRMRTLQVTSQRAAVETDYMTFFSLKAPSLKCVALENINFSGNQLNQILSSATHLIQLNLKDITMCESVDEAGSLETLTKLQAIHVEKITVSSDGINDLALLVAVISKSPLLKELKVTDIYCSMKQTTESSIHVQDLKRYNCICNLHLCRLKLPTFLLSYLMSLVDSNDLNVLAIEDIEYSDHSSEPCLVLPQISCHDLQSVVFSMVTDAPPMLLEIYSCILSYTRSLELNRISCSPAHLDSIFSSVLRSKQIVHLKLEDIECKGELTSEVTPKKTAEENKSLKTFECTAVSIPHFQMENLAAIVQNSTNLAIMKTCLLDCKRGTSHDPCFHYIDLISHSELETVTIQTSSFFVQRVSTTKIKSFEHTFPRAINYKVMSIKFLSYAPYLEEIKIHNADACALTATVPTCKLLENLEIFDSDLENNALVMCPQMANLKTIKFIRVHMSAQALHYFVSSLEHLPNSVHVKLSHCTVSQSEESGIFTVYCKIDSGNQMLVWNKNIERNIGTVNFYSKTGPIIYDAGKRLNTL